MTINFTHTGEKKQKTQDSICKYFCQEIKLAIKCSRLKGNDSWAVMQQDDSPTVKKKWGQLYKSHIYDLEIFCRHKKIIKIILLV